MEKSLFSQWVDKWFKAIAQKVVEKLNGSKEPLTYFHRLMLRKEFSTTLKWGSLSSNNVMVSADVVAMDSSLPLKKRDAIKKYEGDIPKLGMKLYLNERTMADLGILQRTQGQDNEIVRKLFADVRKCTVGVWEALEFMFLQALSTGVTSITDEDNPGQAIRIDFGHPDANKYGAVTSWNDSNARPIDDINRVISKARENGDSIQYLMMDRKTFNVMRNNTQVKQLYGFSVGFVGNAIPTPNLEQLNAALIADIGVSITIVDRTVVFEKNGKRTSKKPFADDTVVFLTDMQVGTLTYGRLAEEDHPAKQVDYVKVDDFILLSKYHKNDPIREYTSSQALVLPVIDNVDSIYILSTVAHTSGAQEEGDDTINIFGDTEVLRSNLINALHQVGKTQANDDMTDAQLVNLVNKLSKAKKLELKQILEIPIVSAGDDDTGDASTYELVGTAEAAAGKTIVSTLWTKVSGPAATITNPDALTTNVTGLTSGTYVFKLTATDSAGTVASDTVEIVITIV